MSVSDNNSVKTEAYKIVFWQFIVTLGLALILFILRGIQGGISTLLGGLAYCVPNLIFVRQVFSNTGARAAQKFLLAFVLGETAKLFLSAILCVLIVKYLHMSFPYVLTGYVGAIVAFWVVSMVIMSREPQGGSQ